MNQKQSYTGVKAPRYDDLPFEVGTLARLWLNGEYRSGISAMDRTSARAIEAKKITQIAEILLDQVKPDLSVQQEWQLLDTADPIVTLGIKQGELSIHSLRKHPKCCGVFEGMTIISPFDPLR